MLKKVFTLVLIFTIAFFNVSQFNSGLAKAEDFLNSTPFSAQYVEDNVEYQVLGNLDLYKLTLNDITYELTYDRETELFSTKAISVVDGLNHVTVKPVDFSRHQEWRNSKDNANNNPHEFTKILQAISVSSKN